MSATSEESLSVSTLASSTTAIHPDPGSQNGDSTTQFGTISMRRLSRRLSLWRPKKRATVLAVIVATIGSFCLGNVLTWSSPVLPQEDFKKKFPDIGNGSWVASLALLGALFAAPVSGFLIAKIGRRRTMLFTAFPFSIGWFLIAFAPDLPVLYIGRFLTGFCGGAFTVSVPAYVAEVTEDRIRGTLAVAFILMLCIGILFTIVLGALVNWFVLSVVCGCIPIIFFFSMLCMPESPRYLVMIQKPTAARNALKWLRRASTKRYIEPEITKIESSVTAANGKTNGGSSVKDLLKIRVLKPIFISAALMFFAQLSGMNGVSLYTVEIFAEAGTQMNASVASIIILATQALTVLVVPFVLVEKLGRRSLLIISEVVMCISLTALGTYFYLKDKNGGNPPDDLEWLPLVSLVAITIGYNVGLGPIPWVLTAEILPNHVKELASSCISICYWTLSFVAGKTFKDIKDVIGYSGVYWLSSGICLIGALFVLFFVPETKGRSTDEIQKLFVTKKESAQAESSEQQTKPTGSPDGVDNPSFMSQSQGANVNAV
ncbi:Facilitated trehalose transporter Tret1 [Orchesella cincta]|uniref:Facilitated trehalose transporter Tret1 n=1 Tax=Orchesella cincta TaxID=48709 RepID=A0A1D2MP00_ORCCI|nr:Facilitated trehalose transporter Tret1 [Orchesella cincta]